MKDYKKYSFLFFLPLLLFIFSCNKKNWEEEYRLAGQALGTTYSVIYFSEEEFDAEKGLDSIIDAVNQSMSTYIETSDISKLNSGDNTVVVDEYFQEVFRLSKEVHQNSSGYFDPTVGNLVNAYGFGSAKKFQRIDSTTVDSLLVFVGLDKVQISSEGEVSKEVEGVYLEFNAIAKGYTVDLFARFFDSKNVKNYLVEVGGELVAKGKNIEKDKDWVVAIDDPMQTEEERTFQATLKLKDRAMATSGNYRKFRVDSATGQKFVHTINPLTGYPEKSNVLSVSILAENCALADGYATACMAMGLERSKEMLENLPAVDAYIIYAEENGQESIFATPGFEEVLLE